MEKFVPTNGYEKSEDRMVFSQILEKVNDWEVGQAVSKVWGNNSDQIDFGSKRLRKPDCPCVLGVD
jgi:hypothetical protein